VEWRYTAALRELDADEQAHAHEHDITGTDLGLPNGYTFAVGDRHRDANSHTHRIANPDPCPPNPDP